MAEPEGTAEADFAEVVTPKECGEDGLRDAHIISTTALVTTASTTVPPVTADDDTATTSQTPRAALSTVTLRDLYRYASPCDRVLLAVGLTMVVLNGALYPSMAILFGQAISSFQPIDLHNIERVSLAYFAIAVGLFVTDYIAHVCLETAAQKQMHALRIHVFRHVLHKEVAWFERPGKNDAAGGDVLSISQLNDTTMTIKDGIGVKLGEVLRCLTQFGTGYAIGFANQWELSIVMASVMPFMAISLSWIIKTLRERTAFSQRKYAEAGAIAEETLRAIRTVQAFNGEQAAVDRYVVKAKSAEVENIKLVRVLSAVLGIFFGMVWVTYAVGLWFGASLVASAGKTDPKTVFSAFYGILIGTISLAQISPNIAAVVTAKAVATSLYRILDEPSKINAAAASNGVVPTICIGRLDIVNVEFAYPSRPDSLVLHNFSLKISAGETVAFVGPSGGGKSTLMALLQRYYDPVAGQILLDGLDVQSLQLKWLRRQIGIVSQEPVLFAATISENIAAAIADEDSEHGLHEDAATLIRQRQNRIETAAKLANAHDFIMALPSRYETFVGEKGVALSGGQKQRIAIARALVRDPRILILDEATSALDTESEALIQNALDSIISATSRTTLIVAHRLSTIKRADRICVVENGEIVEMGTHEELLQKENGQFLELVMKSGPNAATMNHRNASLVWCDSLTDVLSSGRGSSLPMLAARSTDAPVLESKRSGLFPLVAHPSEEVIPEYKGVAATVEAENVAAEESPVVPNQDGALGTIATIGRLTRHNRNERHLFVLGLLAAALNGLSFPASAILLSAVVSTMVEKYAVFQTTRAQSILDVLYDDVWHLALAFIVGAVLLVAITFTQSFAFRFMAEKLVTRLRDLYFSAMCHQSIGFFDDSKRGSGALASDLATMPTQAAILAGDTPGRVTQAFTTFVGALLVSFLMGSWVLSLVMCVVFPLLIFSDLVRTRMLKGTDKSNDKDSPMEQDIARANTLASEAVTHIRTVVSFGLEGKLIDEYRQLSLVPMKHTARIAHANGVVLGLSSFSTFAVYSLVFWYGGRLVRDGDISFAQLIRSLMAIMISASGIGQATAHLTEVDDAKRAAMNIFAMEDQKGKADVETETESATRGPAKGAIEFQNVVFAYPSRPNITVLAGLNLHVDAGQLVALCGPSGGGKSTVIALLERFYEPLQGAVVLDGVPINTLSRQWLRSQIGLIAQEPVLFAGTIHDNIAYGAVNAASVPREQVEQAAVVANAHGYISAFSDGYDTDLGSAGEQLSGGQKQRLAIARAILRDPSILLLDEATSALDADSEQLVQDALERVIKMKKRTTIVVAHRMRTIRNADKICVVSSGQIIEQGTHEELAQLAGGLYAKLVENAYDERFSVIE